MKHRIATLICSAITAFGLATGGSVAEEHEPGLTLELSAAEDIGGACRMSFLATNSHGTDITQAVFEVVLFNASGSVAQMTLLDFRELPTGRPRVRQFQFDGMGCADVPRILINGAATCDGLAVGGCLENLLLNSRTGTELIG